MWPRLAIVVVLSGCGFQSQAEGSNAPGGDAPGSDASGHDASGNDASSDGSDGSSDCFQHWLDGSVDIKASTVKELTNLSSSGVDRDPWISADGLLLYFARNPGGHGKSDIYVAKRTSVSQDFANPATLDNLDTGDDEGRASVSGDDLILVFSGNHNVPNGKFQIITSTRGDVGKPFASPTVEEQALVASVNIASDDYFDPFLTRDGLKLYFTGDPNGAAPPAPKIMMATRAAGQNFMAATPAPAINSGIGESDPALSRDERIIVFTSQRPAGGSGGTNLWYATRQNATADFSAPRLIPAVNGDAEDGDPMLSDDGCELYFASNRSGNTYHLFHAQVTK
jgi:Tol biopolymer transport system component